MSTAQTARKRLEKALDRLQAAATRMKERSRADEELEGKVDALRTEQERLTAALLKARNEYDALQHVNETVSSRLDETIGQLKRVLED